MKEEDLLISKWLNIVRITSAVLVFLSISLLHYFGFFEFDPDFVLFKVIPIYFILCGVWYLLIKNNFLTKLLYSQLFIDLIFINVGVHYTGGAGSPFAFLSILPVISATIISMRATAVVGATALGFYGGLNYLENTGILQSNSLQVISPYDDERFVVFVLIVFLVAFQAYFFRTSIRKKERELEKVKDDFLFRTVHDLRAPSTVMRAIVDKYDSPEWFKSHPETKEDIEISKEANSRMINLISDLFEIAKGQKTEITFKKERVNVPEVLSIVIREITPLALKKGISIEYVSESEVPLVLADADKLKEVFVNLLDNA